MKELMIQDIETMVHCSESRVMEVKETTGELAKGMQSGCAFLNTEGGWLFFGIHPTKLTILGQNVADRTRQEIAWEMCKFAPAIPEASALGTGKREDCHGSVQGWRDGGMG